MDEIEFPQADPAIQYIARQVGMIQDQYTCNAGYHRDHKELRRRIDKMDQVLSDLNTQVQKLDIASINEIQEHITQSSKEYLDDARQTNAAGLREIKEASRKLKNELSESENLLRTAEKAYQENQKAFEGTVRTMSVMVSKNAEDAVKKAFKSAINEKVTDQLMYYASVAIIAMIIGLVIGFFGGSL